MDNHNAYFNHITRLCLIYLGMFRLSMGIAIFVTEYIVNNVQPYAGLQNIMWPNIYYIYAGKTLGGSAEKGTQKYKPW